RFVGAGAALGERARNPFGLQRGELHRQRLALGGHVQEPLAPIVRALLLDHVALVDQKLEHSAERLLGDPPHVEEVGDLHAGIAVDEMQHAVVRAAEPELGQHLVGVADEISVGKEQKLNQVPRRLGALVGNVRLGRGRPEGRHIYVSHIDIFRFDCYPRGWICERIVLSAARPARNFASPTRLKHIGSFCPTQKRRNATRSQMRDNVKVRSRGENAMAVPFDQMEGLIWIDGKLIPGPDAKIHVLTHGLHYASTVFEGERAYGGEIFKCTEHSERLKRSANILDFEIPYSVAEIDAAKRLVVEKNGQKNAYVRAIAWRGAEQLGVAAQTNKIHLGVATWEWPSYFDPAPRLKGIRLDLAEYRRPDPRTIPALAKAAGLYMICTISKHKAERKGYADAMMLDWEGRVAECTGANIFFVKDGKIH